MTATAKPLHRIVTTSAAVAVLVLIAARVAVSWEIFPAEPLEVKVAWADGLSEQEKRRAASEHRLALTEVRDDGVWITTAQDTSLDVIRAVVRDPRVRDTDGVDRAAFEVLRGAPETAMQWLARQWPERADYIRGYSQNLTSPSRIPLWLLMGAALTFVIVVARAGAPAWLARGIPDLSTAGLALFRMAYGLAMLLAIAGLRFTPLPIDQQRQEDALARLGIVRELAAGGAAFETAQLVGCVALALFIAGAAPRLSLAVAALCLLLLDALMVTQGSIHNWGLPMVTMFMLLLAPWQQGPGLSTVLRRWRGAAGAAVASAPPGLAVWIPGLTLGVAFLAAAHAKLDISGLEWITGGAVRYHFIDDSMHAPTQWGLRIAASDTAAIGISLGAIVLEGGFWLVTLVRRSPARALFGASAAGLLAGFYLLQGAFWPAWWALLLAFFPWGPLADAVVRRLPRYTVLADGECPLCRRTARVLHAVDVFDRLDFADASDDSARERVAPGLARDAALAEMYVVDTAGSRIGGFDGYLRLSRALPVLWIPLVVASLPPIAALGRTVYARVAATRTRIGRCTDEVCDASAPPLPQRRLAVAVAASVPRFAGVVLGLFVLIQVMVSGLGMESEPLVSNFPMYSWTWTREAFDAHLRDEFQTDDVAAPGLGGETLLARLDVVGFDGPLRQRVFDRIVTGRELGADDRTRLREVLTEYRQRFAAPMPPFRLVRHAAAYDWQRGMLEPRAHITFEGMVDFASMLAAGEEH